MSKSRTAKTLKNSIYALTFFAIQFVLAFISRKIFLEYLGEDILGLNTTAVNILQFLNLAELGINSAVSFSLYKPLHNNDQTSINEILSLQGKLYRRIASVIIIGAISVMLFFPLIFKKISLPLWYAYSSFGVLLFSSLLGYFINYRQIILTASQHDYKIQQSLGACNIIKSVTQIVVLSSCRNPYIWWLVTEVLFSIAGSAVLHITVSKSFPYLKESKLTYNELKRKYANLIVKTKQVFFHNIGGFALTQSSPLIIYAYSSLSLVAIYGNYLIVSSGIMRLFNAIFNSMGAGIGDMIAEGDKNRIMKVFYELFALRFTLVATVTFVFITIGQAFVEIWIGEQYLLPLSTLLIIATTLFIRLNRYTVNQFIAGQGQYQDIYSPVIEALLNVGLSILLGYYYGLNGILSGVLISSICVIELWKPFFLFKYGLHESLIKYFVNYVSMALPAVVIGVILYYIFDGYWDTLPHTWIMLAIYTICICLSYLITLCMCLWIISPSFRTLGSRIRRLFIKS
ncbi:MAG: sugar transporter [Bacteroides sp.]|nr:sugar transporter [Bacteroides sp.]